MSRRKGIDGFVAEHDDETGLGGEGCVDVGGQPGEEGLARVAGGFGIRRGNVVVPAAVEVFVQDYEVCGSGIEVVNALRRDAGLGLETAASRGFRQGIAAKIVHVARGFGFVVSHHRKPGEVGAELVVYGRPNGRGRIDVARESLKPPAPPAMPRATRAPANCSGPVNSHRSAVVEKESALPVGASRVFARGSEAEILFLAQARGRGKDWSGAPGRAALRPDAPT